MRLPLLRAALDTYMTTYSLLAFPENTSTIFRFSGLTSVSQLRDRGTAKENQHVDEATPIAHACSVMKTAHTHLAPTGGPPSAAARQQLRGSSQAPQCFNHSMPRRGAPDRVWSRTTTAALRAVYAGSDGRTAAKKTSTGVLTGRVAPL